MPFIIRDQFDPLFGHLYVQLVAGEKIETTARLRDATGFGTREEATLCRQATGEAHKWEVTEIRS